MAPLDRSFETIKAAELRAACISVRCITVARVIDCSAEEADEGHEDDREDHRDVALLRGAEASQRAGQRACFENMRSWLLPSERDADIATPRAKR